jgi:uncharacterized protein
VILVDANVLVYAHVSSFVQHERARDWLDQFLRLMTNPPVFEHPEPITGAWRQVLVCLDCETVWIPQPAEHHAESLGQLIATPGVPQISSRMPPWPYWP